MTKGQLKKGRWVCPANLKLVRLMPCILSGGIADPAHYPKRRSQLGDDGLFNLIPLARWFHDRLDNHEMTEGELERLERLAELYWRRVYDIMLQSGEQWFLGSRERIIVITGEDVDELRHFQYY